MKKFVAALVVMLASAQAYGAGLEVDLSEESGEFSYLMNTRQVEGALDLSLNLFYNEREDVMLSVGMLSLGQQAEYGRPLQLGVGGKVYGGQLMDEREILALGIGGRLAYIVPSSISPLTAVAELYFAPSVTSFSGAERFMDLNTRVELEITPTARGFVGYRLTTVRMDGAEDDMELDDNMHVGVRFNFAARGYR